MFPFSLFRFKAEKLLNTTTFSLLLSLDLLIFHIQVKSGLQV